MFLPNFANNNYIHILCRAVQEYQIEMMRLMREVNIDYMLVGWYQSTFVRSSLNRTLVESQFTYQKAIEASIVLLYG